MGRVSGKAAFITGIARGQGRSHALKLAQEGAQIIGIDLCRQLHSVGYSLATARDLKETVELVEQMGGRIVASQGDVRRGVDLEAAVESGIRAFGNIDIVCINAGIASTGFSWEITEVQWREMIDVNLTGAWLTVRAVIPSMIAAGRGGSIIFTNSIAGTVGRQKMAHYVAAKHGLLGLMRTLANELAQYRIRVNSVSPTNVDTDMIRNSGAYSLYSADGETPTAEGFARAVTRLNAIPVPWVAASDVSNAVLWLASDESQYVTGAVIPVDAGAAIKSP